MQNAEFSGNSLSARLFPPHFSHFSSETILYVSLAISNY